MVTRRSEKSDGQPEETPKQKLLNWIRGKLPVGMPLTNFTSDWNDGIAVGALVNAMVPGAVSDWDQWTPEHALENTQRAMQIAQDRLGVAPLITPGELIHPEIDEMSVMTYLSQFPVAKLDQVARKPEPPAEPIASGFLEGLDQFPKINMPSEFVVNVIGDGYRPKNMHDFFDLDSFSVWGRGINSEGIRVGETVPVHVEVKGQSAEVADDLCVRVVSDENIEVPVKQQTKGSRSTFTYKPTRTGGHTVHVTSRGEPVGQSPYKIDILPATKSRVRAFGPGLEGGIADQQSIFGVETNGDADRLAFSIEGPSKTDIFCQDHGKGAALVSYTPKQPGVYKVNVLAGGEHIAESPFVLKVEPAIAGFHPSAAQLTGIDQGTYFIPGEPASFRIDTRNTGASDDAPSVEVLDKDLSLVPLSGSQIDKGIYGYSFVPKTAGKHHISASLKGVAIPGSPFPTLQRGRLDLKPNSIVTVNCEQEVHVFTPDGDNTRIVIVSPSGSIVEATIESTETGFRVWFTPSEIGDYSISVTYRDLPVGAPYLLHSVPDGNKAEAEYVVARTGPPRADLVTVTGPGLGPVIAQRSTHVSIDTTSAGFGDIDLFVDGPTRTPIHCVDNHDGTLTMYYVPQTPGVYFLRVMFDSSHIAGSPFQVLAVPAILAPSLTAEHDISEGSFTSMSNGSSTPKTTPCA
ncbi:Filamin/ABP280 repeat protein [Ostertagia ostertagi]